MFICQPFRMLVIRRPREVIGNTARGLTQAIGGKAHGSGCKSYPPRRLPPQARSRDAAKPFRPAGAQRSTTLAASIMTDVIGDFSDHPQAISRSIYLFAVAFGRSRAALHPTESPEDAQREHEEAVPLVLYLANVGASRARW